ncbi:conserved hypothetical protein [Vibrio jasicida]|nr:conserved hypothetical protein [Vibrio jasicida]
MLVTVAKGILNKGYFNDAHHEGISLVHGVFMILGCTQYDELKVIFTNIISVLFVRVGWVNTKF